MNGLAPSKRATVGARDGWRCRYCRCRLSDDGDGAPQATLDHWIPRSRRGSNANSNLVLACQPCNVRKGDRTGDEYLALLAGSGRGATVSADDHGGLEWDPTHRQWCRPSPRRARPRGSYRVHIPPDVLAALGRTVPEEEPEAPCA